MKIGCHFHTRTHIHTHTHTGSHICFIYFAYTYIGKTSHANLCKHKNGKSFLRQKKTEELKKPITDTISNIRYATNRTSHSSISFYFIACTACQHILRCSHLEKHFVPYPYTQPSVDPLSPDHHAIAAAVSQASPSDVSR